MGCCKDAISIAQWNVNGLMDKMQDNDFVNIVNNANICFLTETWADAPIQLENEVMFTKNALKKNCLGGRKSGGIAAIVDENIRIGITMVRNPLEGNMQASMGCPACLPRCGSYFKGVSYHHLPCLGALCE